MPARIIAAGALSQRDTGTDQPQILGVVADGVEDLLISLRNGRNSRHTDHALHGIQGTRRSRGVVFPLDLTKDPGHVLAP